MYDDNPPVVAAARWLDRTRGKGLEELPLRWVAVGGDGPVRTDDQIVADEDPDRVVLLLAEAGIGIEDVLLVFVQTVIFSDA